MRSYIVHLRLRIRLSSQLRLLHQTRRRVSPRHVHLNEPQLVRLVERLVGEQLRELVGRVHLDRFIRDLASAFAQIDRQRVAGSPSTSCPPGRAARPGGRTSGYRCTGPSRRGSVARSRTRHCSARRGKGARHVGASCRSLAASAGSACD